MEKPKEHFGQPNIVLILYMSVYLQVVLVVNNPPANAGDIRMQVQSLGWEDPLEEAQKPTPVLLPRESNGQRSLAGYSPYDRKELDMTKAT